ncbi:gliding motility-associated C-terminal domain-containing protein [Ohtaekwangia koreensis]|uniref:Gliding motility-associated C-terminal domain-containing protein n=1 Tax=Ohtaekwangia koreensis TaxID=688867 RepID=A0A1T5KQX1_9BACT|nr:gliding motility-associated C-terminal domain-containing protein [Ohtaekwangia koreensis]SKC65829.1 gliding motility-associated C-terminal domain-containing protein [Ohtaekwangia koreensis]
MRHIFLFLSGFVFAASVFGQGGDKKPKITGQDPVSITEEQAYTIKLTDLDVTDRDDLFYPWGFTLHVNPGANYTLSGSTVTPNVNFTGILSVPVTVNDGKNDSEVYNFKITVNPVNDPPVITGQVALKTVENTAIVIQLSHLTVTDPDNTYPTGFSLSLAGGANYTVSGTTITPATGFTGTLSIGTTVSDGTASSSVYSLKITVSPGNVAPVITGHAALATAKNKPITIQLSNLQVTDPDDVYPKDFTMTVAVGSNYTVSGATVTPAQNFVGTLTVPVTVNDGAATSAPFNVKITVTDELMITGQKPLEINEGQSITLQLSDLVVNDPDNKYPTGFTLQISQGENYTVSNLQITPSPNFTGNLGVSVTVSNGKATSKPYTLTIAVKPVNNAPEIVNLETESLLYTITNDPIFITKTLDIKDADDTNLVLAEISFQPETYRGGFDELTFKNTSKIRGVYDSTKGVLSLIGTATLAEYRDAIRSVQYYYNNVEDPELETKTIYFRLNDGKTLSALYERKIGLMEDIGFDIPNAFTPNNDAANDTWRVKPLKQADRFDNTIIRVYNKRGSLVFETTGFDKEWDGRYNGEVLPPDTYYYTIDLNLTYINTNYKGIVTILR